MTIIGRISIDRARRQNVSRPSTLRTIDDMPIDVELIDLSSTGCLLSGTIEIRPGMFITIGIPGIGVHAARAVRRSGADIGCEFLSSIDQDTIAIAQTAATLINAPFPQSRRPNLINGLPTKPDRLSSQNAKIERLLRYWDKIKSE